VVCAGGEGQQAATELAALGRGWVAAHALGGGLVAKAAQLEEEAVAEAAAEVFLRPFPRDYIAFDWVTVSLTAALRRL
jgi:hypothetical protein